MSDSILQEEFPELLHSVFRSFDDVADGSFICEDFVVISALVCLVTEEVDLLEAFLFDMSKSVSLVPASWEDIE